MQQKSRLILLAPLAFFLSLSLSLSLLVVQKTAPIVCELELWAHLPSASGRFLFQKTAALKMEFPKAHNIA